MTSAQVDTDNVPEEGYERGLGSRQVQMIAIGGAIGVGLFMGAGANIAKAGPSIILMYALAGVVIFFIMRALGELLLYRPVSGSFAEYAREFLGPFFGFVTGWTYWLMWVVTGMAELTAAAIREDPAQGHQHPALAHHRLLRRRPAGDPLRREVDRVLRR